MLHLAHAAGLSTSDLKDLLDSGAHSNGLGRLFRDGLDSGEADKLEDALRNGLDSRDGLDSDDLQKLSVGKLLQIAHVCAVTSRELAELLRED